MKGFSYTHLDRAIKTVQAMQKRQATIPKEIAKIALKSTQDNFASDGREPGWQPRKDSLSHPLLRKSRAMYNATISAFKQAWRKSGETYTLEIKTPLYGLFHQYGAKFKSKSGGIPKRTFIKLLSFEREQAKQAIRKAFLGRKV